PETSQANFDRVGDKTVVGIEKHKALADTVPQSSVTGCRQPLIDLSDIAHSGIPRNDRGGVGRRAAVHHHDLQLRIRLGQHAFDRLPQEMGLLVARDYHRHKRLILSVDILAPAASCPDYPDWDAALIF